MTIIKSPQITLTEFLKLPETKPASEFIDGQIEILSPEQKPNKVIGNILHCLKYGCQLGWFLDPDDYSILVFLPNQQPELLIGVDIVPVLSGIDLKLTVEDIFAWLTIHNG